jgi:predicted DCC family thiol-disulfide oxidoreductase YuxK
MAEQPQRPFFLWAATAFVIGYGIHALDHVRRGMSASPPFIMVIGSIQGVLVAVAVVMAWTHRPRAPLAAVVVGFGSAVGFTYAHLLPTFLPGYQDSFTSAPHPNVTWFSWVSALTEISTGLVFGFAGLEAVQNRVMSGTLFFDGECGMCTRSHDLLLKWDRSGELHTEALQSPGVADRLGISPSHLLDVVRWLDTSGKLFSGAEAVNAALSCAIGTRLPLLLYRIPGIRFVEDRVYRWVAANRRRFPGTTPYCQSHPAAC